MSKEVERISSANPQAENGHIDIAHEIAEALMKINLSPYEYRILWAIWRKTYGWHKKRDRISITQFQKMTGLKRQNVSRTLKRLVNRNIIIRKDDSRIITYGFQKDYLKWKDVIEIDDMSSKQMTHRHLNRCPQKKHNKRKRLYIDSSIEFQLATLLLERIQKNKKERNLSHLKQPYLQKWAREIDLMIRRDGRSPEQIRKVIEWCQKDPFWWRNILSPEKLRKQFDRLEAEMEEKTEKIRSQRIVQYSDL